jgi:hypothetical protein
MQPHQIAAVHLRELSGTSIMMGRDEIREEPGAFTGARRADYRSLSMT